MTTVSETGRTTLCPTSGASGCASSQEGVECTRERNVGKEKLRNASGFIGGKKIHQQLAYRAFPILVRQAKAQQPMYYSNLAAELGMKSPRPLA